MKIESLEGLLKDINTNNFKEEILKIESDNEYLFSSIDEYLNLFEALKNNTCIKEVYLPTFVDDIVGEEINKIFDVKDKLKELFTENKDIIKFDVTFSFCHPNMFRDLTVLTNEKGDIVINAVHSNNLPPHKSHYADMVSFVDNSMGDDLNMDYLYRFPRGPIDFENKCDSFDDFKNRVRQVVRTYGKIKGTNHEYEHLLISYSLSKNDYLSIPRAYNIRKEALRLRDLVIEKVGFDHMVSDSIESPKSNKRKFEALSGGDDYQVGGGCQEEFKSPKRQKKM